MSLTVSKSVYIGPSSLPLGNVVAFSRAEIYKKLFDGWIDLTALQKSFPSRIEIGESMVSFVGPVAIVKSTAMLRAAFIALIGIEIATTAYFVLKRRINRPIAIIFSLVVGGAAAAMLATSRATSGFFIEPGIYFA